MKFNWNQSGMPVSLVSRMGLRNEFAEFKTVLNEAQNQVMTPVDAEAMARELVESGGREYVEMVRELSEALAQTRQELENANRRYDRLTADLARRGVSFDADFSPQRDEGRTTSDEQADHSSRRTDPAAEEQAEWEEWDRRFQSLLA